MATDTIPAADAIRKEAGTALWEASYGLECLAIDAEQLAETASALATAEVFCEAAQAAFASLGKLAEAINAKAAELSEAVYSSGRSVKGGDHGQD